LSEELETIFTDANFDYDGLDADLGSDWLSTFISALEDIFRTDNDEYAVCEDNFVKETVFGAYDNLFSWGVNCWMLILGSVPDCDCLDGADLYNNPDKEATLSSLNCLFEEDDYFTVEQTILQCNGEEIEVDEITTIERAFEELQGLTEFLTTANYGDGLLSGFDAIELAAEFQDVYDALEDLSNVEIVTTGNDSEWLSSVSDYVDKFNELISDLDLDGTYTEQSENLSDWVNDAYDELSNAMTGDGDGSNDDDEKLDSSADKTVTPLVWILVAASACLLLSCICFFWRKNKILTTVVFEREGLVGNFEPNTEPEHELPNRTAVTVGEPDAKLEIEI